MWAFSFVRCRSDELFEAVELFAKSGMVTHSLEGSTDISMISALLHDPYEIGSVSPTVVDTSVCLGSDEYSG